MALRFAANLSTLYREVSFLDRFARAAGAGFGAVEFLFPYEAGVDAIKARLDDLGLKVVLFNLHAGDRGAGEWGTLSHPARRDFFRWSCTAALETAQRLDCRRLNALFGQRVEGLQPQTQIQCAIENLRWAAPQAAQAGVTLLIEPLNPIDFPHCLLHSTAAALEIVTRVNHPALRLQYDVYHAQMSEGNLLNSITACFPYIGHIQIADVPGRHEPGTGEINYPVVLATLDRLGYQGYIGLEYNPSDDTDTSLNWLARHIQVERR